jgi:hypothetical protein
MAMSYKILPKSVKANETHYPCLKVHKDRNTGTLIVLFTQELVGLVVGPTASNGVGYTCDHWAEDEFELFDGTVTLENK